MNPALNFVMKYLSPETTLGKWLPRVFGLVVALAVGFLLARVVWVFVGEPALSQFELPQEEVVIEDELDKEDVAKKIANAHLFGVLNKSKSKPPSAKAPPKKRPPPKINLALHGVVAFSSGDGVAVLGPKGGRQLDSFSVGEEVQSGVQLISVTPTTAVLRRGGQDITLVLEEQKGVSINTSIASLPSPRNSGYSARPNSLQGRVSNNSRPALPEGKPVQGSFSVEDRDKIAANPLSVAKDVSFSPVRVGGKVEGYRLMRVDNSMFASWGLQRGDVVMEVNGKVVSQITNIQAALAEFRAANVLNVKVKRRGRIVPITIDIK